MRRSLVLAHWAASHAHVVNLVNERPCVKAEVDSIPGLTLEVVLWFLQARVHMCTPKRTCT